MAGHGFPLFSICFSIAFDRGGGLLSIVFQLLPDGGSSFPLCFNLPLDGRAWFPLACPLFFDCLRWWAAASPLFYNCFPIVGHSSPLCFSLPFDGGGMVSPVSIVFQLPSPPQSFSNVVHPPIKRQIKPQREL